MANYERIHFSLHDKLDIYVLIVIILVNKTCWAARDE